MSELFIVGTPIGNLSDITLRALDVLKSVDIIACEDTRTTRILCDKYDIKTRLISYHKYSEKARSDLILEYLKEGKNVALVSDAGTPLISDPGGVLVDVVRKEGFKVTPICGACAITSLLSSVNRVGESFKFIGFLPRKENQIEEIIKDNKKENLVFYESPKRILETLEVINKICPQREIAIGRELTKKFEEITLLSAFESLKHYSSKEIKGEFVLMLLADTCDASKGEIKEKIEKLKKQGFSNKDIAKILSLLYGFSKNEIYDLTL